MNVERGSRRGSRACRIGVAMVLAGILAGVVSGCASDLEKADQAFLRDDWDGAVHHYTLALAGATDPTEVATIKEQLGQAKEHGAREHLAKAKQLVEIGDTKNAYQHAATAFEYDPSPEASELLAGLRLEESERLLQVGEAALASKDWMRAVEALEAAEEIESTPAGAKMLAEARRGLQEQRGVEIAAADEALAARNWEQAVARYKAALAYGDADELQSRLEFAELMVSAETSMAKAATDGWDETMATFHLERALRHGIDTEYVQSRLDLIRRANYVVTLHGAVILPFKPQEHTQWDGAGGALAEADAILGQLGALAGPQNQVAAELAVAVAQVGMQGTAAPDCYPIIQVAGMAFGGEQFIDQDDYQPQWNVPVTFPGASGLDSRVVSVIVRDDDLQDDDNVGSYQTTVGELIARRGAGDLVLIAEGGVLKAGGILALKVSVEERP